VLLCFVLAAFKRHHEPQEEADRVFHPDDPLTGYPKRPSALQTEGHSHWVALNMAAAKSYVRRNPGLAAPEPQHVLNDVPLAWRSDMQDAQFKIRSTSLMALGPIGRDGVRFRDTGSDRKDALLNRPPPGTRDVYMLGSVAVPLERTYLFEERPNRVAQALARAAEQQARAAEQHDERRRKTNARAHRNRKARRLAQYESQKHAPAEV
jgi:hypothetical protein